MDFSQKFLSIVLSINNESLAVSADFSDFCQKIKHFINIDHHDLYNLIIIANKTNNKIINNISDIIGQDDLPKHNFIRAFQRKESNYIGHGFSYAIAKADSLLHSKYTIFLTLDEKPDKDFWSFIKQLAEHHKNIDDDFILISDSCKNSQHNISFDSINSEFYKSFPTDCLCTLYKTKFLTSKLKYYFEDYYKEFMNHLFLLNCLQNSANGRFIKKNILGSHRPKKLPKNGLIESIHKLYYADPSTDNLPMTAIIAFRNEKAEVERTVKSIRWTSKNINICLINDASDDDYDYESTARVFKCEYIKNEKQIGSAGSKNKGAYLCKTPYFCFFDAHMRIYKQDWDLMCVDFLKKHPKAIISSRTCYMALTDFKDDGASFVKNECADDTQEGVSWCCCIRMDGGFSFDPKWTDKRIDKNPKHSLSPVACVLGACYAISTDWWKTIGGFNQIQNYGLEESLMSIKSWLYGGECFVVKNWGVGHIYRKENPNPVTGNDIDANRLSLINYFYYNDDESRTKYINELKNRIGSLNFEAVQRKYNAVKDSVEQSAQEFLNGGFDRTMEWFFKNVNDLVVC